MLTANRENTTTTSEQQHLALEFIWLIPSQAAFCSFFFHLLLSLIVFHCRVRFFSAFLRFRLLFILFVCLVQINDKPFSYCCCCWPLIVEVAAVNLKYFLFPCIRRSTICSSSEWDGLFLRVFVCVFSSSFKFVACVRLIDSMFRIWSMWNSIESNKKFHFDVWSLPFIDSFRLIWSTICIILSFILINVICLILVPSYIFFFSLNLLSFPFFSLLFFFSLYLNPSYLCRLYSVIHQNPIKFRICEIKLISFSLFLFLSSFHLMNGYTWIVYCWFRGFWYHPDINRASALADVKGIRTE